MAGVVKIPKKTSASRVDMGRLEWFIPRPFVVGGEAFTGYGHRVLDQTQFPVLDRLGTVMTEEQKGWASALRLTHVGVQFALIFGLCLYGGHYLDQTQNTAPIFTLLGVMFGFGAAFFHLYREVTGMGKMGQGNKPSGQKSDPESK